jgi:hypothetical protein
MFPFAFSEMNVAVSNPFAAAAWSFLEPTFMVGAIGIAAFAMGGLAHKIVPVPVYGFEQIESSLRNFWTTKRGVALGAILSVFLISIMLLIGFEFGKARTMALQSGHLRPLFNTWHILHPFVILNTLIYAFVTRSTGAYVLGLSLAALGIFGETRYASIEPLAAFLAVVCIYMGKRIRLRFVLPAGIVLIAVAIQLGGVRHGEYGLNRFTETASRLLYGNQFSDLRDTAMMLSGWEGQLLLGKSHAAALISFVPSYLSPFRERNKFATFTLNTSGLGNVKAHPGLRPIVFAEFYVNYGLPGVVFLGFAAGVLVFKLHALIGRGVGGNTDRQSITVCLAAMTYLSLLHCVLITSYFYAFYILLGFLFFGWLLGRARLPVSRGP